MKLIFLALKASLVLLMLKLVCGAYWIGGVLLMFWLFNGFEIVMGCANCKTNLWFLFVGICLLFSLGF